MEQSILLARIIGPLFLVLSLALLFHPGHFKAAASEIIGSPALLFMSGMMRLFLGLLLLSYYHVWEQNWEVIFTILAWLLILKGAFVLLFPETTKDWAKPWVKKNSLFVVGGVVFLVLGGYLSYAGYMI